MRSRVYRACVVCSFAWLCMVYFGGERRAALAVDTHWHKRVKTGIQPYMLFHLKEDLGHVHIRFKEPLAQEMNISCYYAQSDAFHVLQQKNAYLVEGTTEAFFSVPFGNWDSYRLGIDGDFVLESIEGVKSVPLSQIRQSRYFYRQTG